jgi:hypothetical protein
MHVVTVARSSVEVMPFMFPVATVAPGVQDLAASHSIQQIVHVIEEHEKDALLGKLLGKFRKNGHEGRVMVFVLYKKVLSHRDHAPSVLAITIPITNQLQYRIVLHIFSMLQWMIPAILHR